MPPRPCCIWTEPFENAIPRSAKIWARNPLNHKGRPFPPNMTKARLGRRLVVGLGSRPHSGASAAAKAYDASCSGYG
jgi:hypothetical protein